MSTDLLIGAAGTATGSGRLRTTTFAWQRTDTVGTELVRTSPGPGPVDGSAVIAGRVAYACWWQATLADDAAVHCLTVTCEGADWYRTVRLSRDAGGWSCHTEDAGAPLTGEPPGADDTARLDPAADIVLADAPVFASWAVRRLGLTVDAGPVVRPVLHVRRPSLRVRPATAVYQLVAPRRLRISGDGPTGVYDLDESGLVIYHKGRSRLVR